MISRIILLLLFAINSYADFICNDNDAILTKLKTKYADKIVDLKINKYINSQGIICSKLKKKENLELIVWLYADENEEEGVYDLSLLMAIVDINKHTIKSSNFFENIAINDAIAIGNIEIDIDSYSKISENDIFAIEIEFEGSSNPNPYRRKTLFVYENHKGSIREVINRLNVLEFSGEWDTKCDGLFKIVEKKEIIFKGNSEYPPIQVSLSNKEKKQSLSKDNGCCLKAIKNQPDIIKNLLYDGEKYIQFENRYNFNSLTSKLAFAKKNLTKYNNIAYYLQKAGANEEAVFLLKKIVKKFPNRTVAYYNLGDAYWALGEKDKAIKAYTTYIEQMRNKGLQKKIPKEILNKVKN